MLWTIYKIDTETPLKLKYMFLSIDRGQTAFTFQAQWRIPDKTNAGATDMNNN